MSFSAFAAVEISTNSAANRKWQIPKCKTPALESRITGAFLWILTSTNMENLGYKFKCRALWDISLHSQQVQKRNEKHFTTDGGKLNASGIRP